MKKNLLKLFTIMLFPVFLTGCMNVDTEITIDKKGNATSTMKLLIREEANEFFGDIFSNTKDFEEEGSSVSKISEKGNVGILKTCNSTEIYKNDICAPKIFKPKNKNNRFISMTQTPFYTEYKLDWVASFAENPKTKETIPEESQKLIKSSLKINIPAKASSSNADSRNDITNSYSWNFDTTKSNDIYLEYRIINWINIVLFIIVLSNILVCIMCTILKKNKKVKIISIIPLLILITYFVFNISFCIVKNNINKSDLPVDYYKIAKENENVFVDDFAVAKVNDKYGLVDKENNFIVKAENKYVENLDEDFCLVCKDDLRKCAYFNKKTKKYLTDFKYMCKQDVEFIDDMTSLGFQEGLARVVISEHGDINVGFIDATGKEVIKPKYKTATPFVDGESIVTRGFRDYEGISIDKNGNEIKKSENKENKIPNKSNQSTQITNKSSESIQKVSQKNTSQKNIKTQTKPVSIKQENNEVEDFMN